MGNSSISKARNPQKCSWVVELFVRGFEAYLYIKGFKGDDLVEKRPLRYAEGSHENVIKGGWKWGGGFE